MNSGPSVAGFVLHIGPVQKILIIQWPEFIVVAQADLSTSQPQSPMKISGD